MGPGTRRVHMTLAGVLGEEVRDRLGALLVARRRAQEPGAGRRTWDLGSLRGVQCVVCRIPPWRARCCPCRGSDVDPSPGVLLAADGQVLPRRRGCS